MATITKRILSGSTSGEPINISATGIDGPSATLIHQATSNTTTIDRVTVYAANSSTSVIRLSFYIGTNSTNPNISGSNTGIIRVDVLPTPPNEASAIMDGPTLCLSNLCLLGRSASALGIYVGATTSGTVSVWGEVERIVQS